MKQHKILYTIFVLCLVYSCFPKNRDDKSNSDSMITSNHQSSYNATLPEEIDTSFINTTNLKLDYIFPIPEVVRYGGGSFTYDSIPNLPHNHIFISNLTEDTALISLHGRWCFLGYDTIASKPRYDDSIKVVWKRTDLTAILRLKVLDETGDEINCKGTIEILIRNKSHKIKIHGSYED